MDSATFARAGQPLPDARTSWPGDTDKLLSVSMCPGVGGGGAEDAVVGVPRGRVVGDAVVGVVVVDVVDVVVLLAVVVAVPDVEVCAVDVVVPAEPVVRVGVVVRAVVVVVVGDVRLTEVDPVVGVVEADVGWVVGWVVCVVVVCVVVGVVVGGVVVGSVTVNVTLVDWLPLLQSAVIVCPPADAEDGTSTVSGSLAENVPRTI